MTSSFTTLLLGTAALLYSSAPTIRVSAEPALKQVHVITRHGARTPLGKDADSLSEEGGSTLTPLGQKQLYDLGAWLRQTYNKNEFLEYYDSSEIRLESSNLDRTLTSANSLSLGLFPLHAQAGLHGTEVYTSLLPEMPSLPVYTRKEQNDVFLRTYINCPKFVENLRELYVSTQWVTMEQNNQSILRKLATIFPDEVDQIQEGEDASVALQDIWSLYDKIHVARTECETNTMAYACVSLEVATLKNAMSDAEFQELETLMAKTEQMKYGISTAGNLLGSNLLWQILSRARDDGKFFLYSAHAPTVLGFLSTIQEWSVDERFVEYGSAVIVEIYEDPATSKSTIRFLYKTATSTVARYLPISHADCEETHGADDVPHCSLMEFVTWTAMNTLLTEEDWCEACGNEEADICMQAKLDENAMSQEIQDFEQAITENGQESLVIAGTFFGGFFAGLIMMGLSCCVCRRCQNRRKGDDESSEPQSPRERLSSQERALPEVDPTTNLEDANENMNNIQLS
jgi:hypothetical protein